MNHSLASFLLRATDLPCMRFLGRLLVWRHGTTLAMGIMVPLFCATLRAESQKVPLPLVKARMVRVVLDYVRWPEQRGLSRRKMRIGVVGELTFREQLNQAFGSTGDQACKSLIYLPADAKERWESFDALLIGGVTSHALSEITQQIKGQPVLLLSDALGFSKRGGMINLSVELDKIKLEVNLKNTRTAGLELDSNLLKNARIVE